MLETHAQTNKLSGLQALCAFAAFSVVLYYAVEAALSRFSGDIDFTPLREVAWLGIFGVDGFL
jgi:peptidoglycan/LPS O-acetylase OafA/YrhL